MAALLATASAASMPALQLDDPLDVERTPDVAPKRLALEVPAADDEDDEEEDGFGSWRLPSAHVILVVDRPPLLHR
jgi:hypothetical protein